MKLRETWNKYDPAEVIKKKYKLKGVAAEIVDLAVGFIVAGLIYFIIMPLLLGANPAAVVVQTCSMTGTYNVGDIVVLRGAAWDDINAPEITASSIHYTIEPNNITHQTKKLIFADTELDVEATGDVIVYNSKTSGVQIIHRVIAKVTTPDGRYYITKGDTNAIPDSSKIDCAEFINDRCTKISYTVSNVCTEEDRGWPGCIGTPLKEDEIVGKHFFTVPLLGHVKMLFFHILTLGNGYPGPMWC